MELKIIKEEQNPLFNRKEIIATTPKIDSSPKKQEVIQALSKKYSIPTDALRVIDIKGKFGANEFTIRANIYPSNEERNKYEKLTKKEIAVESKPAEVLVEEKPEEAKSEEKPVVEIKQEPTPEEDKKEKDKSKEEKLNETELQA